MFLKEKCVVNNSGNIQNTTTGSGSKISKMRGKGGLLDFGHHSERNKENSFLDIDWIIEELLAYGRDQKIAKDVSKTPSPGAVSKSGSTSNNSSKHQTKNKRVSNIVYNP